MKYRFIFLLLVGCTSQHILSQGMSIPKSNVAVVKPHDVNLAEQLVLNSPNGRNCVSFSKPDKELIYNVTVDGEDVILPSRAGLQLDNRVWEMALGKRDLAQPDVWMEPLTTDSVTYYPAVDSLWHPLYGERSTVKDRYNSATLHLSRKDKSNYRLDV